MSDNGLNDIADIIKNLGKVEEKMDEYERKLGSKTLEVRLVRLELDNARDALVSVRDAISGWEVEGE